MFKYCFFNNKIIPVKKIRISPNDLGILRGYGVFDFLRTYDGKPFLLKEHLIRFRNSAKTLNIEVPYGDEKIAEIIHKLLRRNKVKDVNVRIVLTGGPSHDAKTITSPTFYILIEEIHDLPKEYFIDGIKVITVNHKRENPGAKTLNYMKAISIGIERESEGAYEIVYAPEGNVLEATTSNIFIIKNGALITPKDGILIGTTRNFVIDIAKEMFEVIEKPIIIDELYSADEVFLTATNKEILPVTEVNDRIIGNKKVGENTKKLIEMFRNRILNNEY